MIYQLFVVIGLYLVLSAVRSLRGNSATRLTARPLVKMLDCITKSTLCEFVNLSYCALSGNHRLQNVAKQED